VMEVMQDYMYSVCWIRLHNEELRNLYASRNIIRVSKSGGGEIGGECSTHGRDETRTKFWLKNLSGRYQAEDLGLHGKVILEWFLRK
jgi:hypothetical protein